MSALGSLVVKLALEHAEFTKGLDKSSQESLKFAKNAQAAVDKVERSFGNMAKTVVGIGAAYLSVNSIISTVNASIDTLAKLDDSAQKTGSTVENLSRLQKVAVAFGADFDAIVEPAITKLAKGLGGLDEDSGKANNALKALGISSRDSNGNLRDTSAITIEVAKKLQDYQDGAAKATLVTDLFGKSGADLLPYLNDMAESVDRYTGASAESAANAAALQDQINGLKQKTGEYITTLVVDALPALNDLLGAFIDINGKSTELGNNKSIGNWADETAISIAYLYDTFSNLKDLLSAIGGSFAVVFADIKTFGAAARTINPLAYVTGAPLKDLSDALASRNETLKNANAEWEALVNKNRSAAEDAVRARIEARPTLSASPYVSPNSDKPTLNYITDSAAKQAAADSLARTKAKNAEILKDLQASISEEQDMLEAKYKFESDLQKQLDKEKEDSYKKQLERLDDLQKVANDNFEQAQRDFKQLEDARLREFEKTVDGINQVFREGFANMVNGGKNTWKSFTKSLVTTFKTTVADSIYKMLAQPFIVRIVASLLGVGVSGGASAAASSLGSTSSGSGSIFGMIKDGIGSINSNITGAIESVGSYITDGLGGIGDTIGGYIGANAASIANGFSYAGALFQAAQGNFTGAIGTAIGTYFGGPVGGAIGSMVGNLVGGLFGGSHVSRPKYYANTAVTNSGSSLINAYGNSDAKGTGGDVAINSGKGLADAILTYTKAFGGTSKDFTLGMNYQSKYNMYLATIGGNTAKDGVGSDFQFKPEQAMNATALAFVTAVKNGLVTIPAYLTNVIQRSNIDINNAIDSINTLGAVRSMMDSLKSLPPVFKSIGDAINKTLTLDKVAELQTRFNAINTYTALFYSDAEKLGFFTKQVQSQFTALNQSLPASRDAFRALVDGVDTTTASGLGLFNSLVDLAPMMDAYYKALQQQKDATQNVVDAMANLDINKFKTLVDYTRAQRYIENGNSTQGIPGFASGGMHSGGLRIVGENGPEMEATGPARIINNRELMNSLRNPDHGSAVLVAEIGRLRQENQAGQVAIVQATQKMAKILDKFDNQGIAISETDNSGTRIILDTRVVA